MTQHVSLFGKPSTQNSKTCHVRRTPATVLSQPHGLFTVDWLLCRHVRHSDARGGLYTRITTIIHSMCHSVTTQHDTTCRGPLDNIPAVLIVRRLDHLDIIKMAEMADVLATSRYSKSCRVVMWKRHDTTRRKPILCVIKIARISRAARAQKARA